MNAIDMLKQQHREVEEFFTQIENAEGEEAATLFAQLADAFVVHSQIEERIFYPAVFRDKTEDELREAVEEHLQAKRLFADMLDMDPSDPQWTAKCAVLKEDIQHHVQEEEDELFPTVMKELGSKRLDELGDEMQARAESLQEEGELRMRIQDETEEAVLPV